MKYKIIDVKQNTPEWFQIRKQKMTASNAQAIGNNGKGLDTYILELMSEYYSSAEKESYTNEDLERGHVLEAEARNLYEIDKRVEVKEVGFIEVDENLGCSPDGLVGKVGLVEIKCPNDKTYLDLLLNGKIKSEYIWQTQMQMLLIGRKWCDLVFYNPNYKKCLKIYRQYPDKATFEKLTVGIDRGKRLIEEIKKQMDAI